MHRRTANLLLLFVASLALVPAHGAGANGACAEIDPARLDPAALPPLILIGTAAADGDSLVIEPEGFLRGTASREPVRLGETPPDPACGPAPLKPGERYLLFLDVDAAGAHWPAAGAAFALRDGRATRLDEGLPAAPEAEVVSQVRSLTGQYAVPAQQGQSGAGIDLRGTILPVGVVLLVVFGIGLVLMRIWHRIDPS
ncbi:hypothetical protein [Tepidiforma sp.]|uniref:hypothetical protein n=1 Tax=Tepidiforma sp. TaxID=2682230 RepID=UPI002ADD4EAA|nr:hypothetical protein [Tepidiforma sp.]